MRNAGCDASTTAGSSYTSGACVDMPNEPPESNFKHKVKVGAYRGADFGGMTWVYMGPRSGASTRGTQI